MYLYITSKLSIAFVYNKSLAQCETAVSLLLTPWRYCSLALSHRNGHAFLDAQKLIIPDSRIHGANMGPLGPVGPRWVPCWPHQPCYQGYWTTKSMTLKHHVSLIYDASSRGFTCRDISGYCLHYFRWSRKFNKSYTKSLTTAETRNNACKDPIVSIELADCFLGGR